jgi:A1 cistron-splicing factor AAR2
VYRWLPAIEDVIQIIETEELERFRVNLKQIEPQLGAYPQTSPEELRKYTQWKSLTCHISANVVNRLLVDDGRLTSMTASTIPDETGVQLAGGHSDTTEIQFTCIPLKQSYPPGAIGQERSKYSQDKSWLLSDMLSQRLPANEMLGEMQLAFLLLLVAHNFEGLEQWKLLVQLVCFSREFARSGRAECEEFLERFGKVLRAQLQQVPRDFFEDIVSRGNFLWHSLMVIFVLQ